MTIGNQEGTVSSDETTEVTSPEETLVDDVTTAQVDKELGNIVSESAPKTPIELEVDKYMGKFQDEEGSGLTPEMLQANLVRAGFFKVENNRYARGSQPNSGMVLEAYKRALGARRQKIEAEEEKCLNTLKKSNGNKNVLEEALVKQGILRRGKEGALLPQKDKSLEYKGYLSALKKSQEQQ